MNSGVIFGISQDWRGDALSIDASATDVVLTVRDACDFDEEFPTARYLVVGAETAPRRYIATDLEANTITLEAAVGGTGLEAGLPVVLWDPTVGSSGARAVDYIAKVELHDGSGAPDVLIPHEMIPAAGVYNLVGASVTIDENDDGDLVIGEVLGRENVSDGAYVALDDGTTLEDIYAQANSAAAAAADAAANATTALTAANGKNKVTYSLSTPGATLNAAGDIWFQKDSASQTIIGQWIGGGGSTWVSTQLRNEVIANLDAGKLVAGSAFTNALSVKTNFTLGDASTNGVIQSYNFAGSQVGVFIDKNGLVAKGGSLAAAAITGSTFTTTGTWPVDIASGRVGFGAGASQGSISYNGSRLLMSNTNGNVGLDGSGAFLEAKTGLGVYIGNTSGADWLSMTATQATMDLPLDVTGDLRLTSLPASSGGTDVQMGASGRLFKISSSRRYKTAIKNADTKGLIGKLRKVKVRQWRYKKKFADPNDPSRLHIGGIAEELEDLGLGAFVVYDDHGRPDAINEKALVWPLLAWVRELERTHAQQIDTLTARIEALEAS